MSKLQSLGWEKKALVAGNKKSRRTPKPTQKSTCVFGGGGA